VDDDSRTRVLIAGAGPTGLVLACDLARRGIDFRLVDSATEPFRGSRAKGVQPRTLEVFDDLGIADQVLADGGNYPRFRIHLGPLSFTGGRLGKIRQATPAVPYPNLWMLPQSETLGLLRARLTELGGKPELGVTFTDFSQDDQGVSLTLSTASGPERVRADFLVGCDGGHSRVREALGVPLIGETLESPPAVMGDVEIEGLDRERWHIWPLAKGCLLTLCPIPGTSDFQLAAPLRAGMVPPELTEDGIRRFIETALGAGKLRVGRVRWSGLYRSVQARMVNHYRVGRVLLAGDAAHVHPPSGGQGLNTGIQDAYNLGWKLAGVLRGAPDDLLNTYERERLPIAAAVLGLSKKLYLKRSLRRGTATDQLSLNYRGGPLAVEARSNPGRVSAGDRAPDAPGQDGGRPWRLFDAFRGPHWTLLAFDGRDLELPDQSPPQRRWPWTPAVRVLHIREPGTADTGEREGEQGSESSDVGDFMDLQGQARANYDAQPGTLMLVRPDGYLGHCADPGGWAEIDSYLARVLGSAACDRSPEGPRRAAGTGV
jgi:2-polyprenyl-6-methoxyphenol hydroxylase-like FAD-dependent oxidoreductase